MDDSTAARLIALNTAFYAQAEAEFDRTRRQGWPGWRRLLAHLPEGRPLRVLDAGCGNGRLGVFLAGQGVALDYTGVDSSAALLLAATTALAGRGAVGYTLIEADFITDPRILPAGLFDLVALFGVLHHVPGQGRRERLIRALAERVAEGGVLAFTAWRFLESERFRGHLVTLPGDLALEAGDYFLDWRAGAKQAVRYCHHTDDTELDALVQASDLTLLDAYRADGETGDLNAYRVLKR